MNLESDKRLNIQLRLDFSSAPTGEARQAGREDIESLSVVHEPERPANTSQIMEEICERANLKEALRQVRSNKGNPACVSYSAPTAESRFRNRAAIAA
jgi:RNA-directed DNA polymerase